MNSIKYPYLRVIFSFSISPGVVGVLYYLLMLIIKDNELNIDAKGFELLIDIFKFTVAFSIYVFVGAELLYLFPAFLLGLLYASLKLERNWSTYLFVVVISPAFLFLYQTLLNDYFSEKQGFFSIPLVIEYSTFLMLMCPLASLASIIAARLAFPKITV